MAMPIGGKCGLNLRIRLCRWGLRTLSSFGLIHLGTCGGQDKRYSKDARKAGPPSPSGIVISKEEKRMRRIALLVACTLALGLCAGTAFGQADTLKVDYFANANTSGAPDGTVRIDSPGTAAGNVCASIYVFDPEQELSECCSCLLTPDGLRTLSVNTDLTSNPLTGVVLSTGVIKFVSTIPVAGACPLPTAVNSEPALRAWTTHIQNGSFQ